MVNDINVPIVKSSSFELDSRIQDALIDYSTFTISNQEISRKDCPCGHSEDHCCFETIIFRKSSNLHEHESSIWKHMRSDKTLPPYPDSSCKACKNPIVKKLMLKQREEKGDDYFLRLVIMTCEHQDCKIKKHIGVEALSKHISRCHKIPCIVDCPACNRRQAFQTDVSHSDSTLASIKIHQSSDEPISAIHPNPQVSQRMEAANLLNIICCTAFSTDVKHISISFQTIINEIDGIFGQSAQSSESSYKETFQRIKEYLNELHDKNCVIINQSQMIQVFALAQSKWHCSPTDLGLLSDIIDSSQSSLLAYDKHKKNIDEFFLFKENITDKSCSVDLARYVEFVIKRYDFDKNSNSIMIKFEMDSNTLTKTKKKFNSFSFQLFDHDSGTRRSMQPINTHVFLIYEFEDHADEQNYKLHFHLKPISEAVNDVFQTKSIKLLDGYQLKFKDVFFGSDLQAWVYLIGLGNVYSPNARYFCPLCLVYIIS
jgi:hypothetical protein